MGVVVSKEVKMRYWFKLNEITALQKHWIYESNKICFFLNSHMTEILKKARKIFLLLLGFCNSICTAGKNVKITQESRRDLKKHVNQLKINFWSLSTKRDEWVVWLHIFTVYKQWYKKDMTYLFYVYSNSIQMYQN